MPPLVSPLAKTSTNTQRWEEHLSKQTSSMNSLSFHDDRNHQNQYSNNKDLPSRSSKNLSRKVSPWLTRNSTDYDSLRTGRKPSTEKNHRASYNTARQDDVSFPVLSKHFGLDDCDRQYHDSAGSSGGKQSEFLRRKSYYGQSPTVNAIDSDASDVGGKPRDLMEWANEVIGRASLTLNSCQVGDWQSTAQELERPSMTGGNFEGKPTESKAIISPEGENKNFSNSLKVETKSRKEDNINLFRTYLHAPYAGSSGQHVDSDLHLPFMSSVDSPVGTNAPSCTGHAPQASHVTPDSGQPESWRNQVMRPSRSTPSFEAWNCAGEGFCAPGEHSATLKHILPSLGAGIFAGAQQSSAPDEKKNARWPGQDADDSNDDCRNDRSFDPSGLPTASPSIDMGGRKILVTSIEFEDNLPSSDEIDAPPSPPRNVPSRMDPMYKYSHSPNNSRTDFPGQRHVTQTIGQEQSPSSRLPYNMGQPGARLRHPRHFSEEFPLSSYISRASSDDSSKSDNSSESRDGLFDGAGHDSVSTLSDRSAPMRRPKIVVRPPYHPIDMGGVPPRYYPGYHDHEGHFRPRGPHGMYTRHARPMPPQYMARDYGYPPRMYPPMVHPYRRSGGPGRRYMVDEEPPRPSCLGWLSRSCDPPDMEDSGEELSYDDRYQRPSYRYPPTTRPPHPPPGTMIRRRVEPRPLPPPRRYIDFPVHNERDAWLEEQCSC